MKRRREQAKNPTFSASSSSIIPANQSSDSIEEAARMKETRDQKSPVSFSIEIVGSIDDLLRQILLKLPIESLLRLKSMCKSWRSLISDPTFLPNPNSARGILYGCKSRYQYIPLYPNKNTVPLETPPINHPLIRKPSSAILNACNGLILYAWQDTLFVCNLTTTCYTPLPPDPTDSLYENYLLSVECDIIRMPVDYYVVFDPLESQHYRVLIARGLICRGESETEPLWIYLLRIYSSETNTWSSGGVIKTSDKTGLIEFGFGVYCNGSFHCLAFPLSMKGLHFDVDTLVLGEMPSLPSFLPYYDSSYHYFGESCGHLHFAECILPELKVYELARDYSEWFVKYRMDLSNLIAQYPAVKNPDGSYHTYIMSLIRGMNDEADSDSSFLVLRIPNKAIKCNLVDGSIEKLFDFDQDIFIYTLVVYFPCLTNV